MSKPSFRLAPLRAGFTLLALALAGFWAAPHALAQANSSPPERMTYQGFLADGNGNPLGNTNTGPKNYDVILRIWADPTGGPSALWAEQQTVTVDKGYFSVLLGEGTAVAPEPHNNLSTLFASSTASERYVEMTVKGIGVGGANLTIQPRLRLLTSPYAYLATKAVSASTVDGSALTTGTVADARLSLNVALRAGGNTFSGDQRFGSGNLYMDNNRAFYAKNSAGADEIFLWPRYADNVTYLNYGTGGFNIRNNGSLSRMFITDAGNVGIGTTTPGIPLNFPNTLGDKISLYGQSGNTYGFGIRGSLLQIHSEGAGSDIAFGYGNSASDSGMTETMRIKGNGNVGIGTPSPAAKLHVAGDIRAANIQATDIHATGVMFEGSGTGAAGTGGYGLITRRVASTDKALGTVVARTDVMTLIRDGTTGGLRVTWAGAAGRNLQINTVALASNGGFGGNHGATAGTDSGTYQAIGAGAWADVRITFGDAYLAGHWTEVHLIRYVANDDFYYVGTITSTYNQ